MPVSRTSKAPPSVVEKKLARLIGPAERIRMAEDISRSIDIGIPDTVNHMTVSEWAEEKRILQPGLSPMPGPFRFSVAPYLREIADCFSETSAVNKVAIMKGAQLGFTVGIGENWIGYVIDAAPGPMMFVSGDKEMAQEAIEVRVDRMIESAGLSAKIFSQSEKKHGKKTGDTKAKKEFAGGFLLARGPHRGGKLRSFSVRYLFFDEVDAYPLETENEGDPLSLAEKRTVAFERIRKILYISTPLVEQTSRIKPLFEAGDRRKYYVPCKYCGEMQVLDWGRMKFEKDERGNLVWESVGHECAACGKLWRNADKAWFLPRGEWRSTARATEPGYRSYHLSSLYSPVGMQSWESICQEWIRAKDDTTRLRAFVNTILGETWLDKGEAPRWEKLMARRENYREGTCPGNAILVTVGADVQKDRIEAEIVAWGKDKESWSLGYHVFPGDTSDIESTAWRYLAQLLAEKHAGMSVSMALIDAGYVTPVVYQFCERYDSGVFPSMGDSRVGKYAKFFQIKPVSGYTCRRVDLNTNPIKQELYAYLEKAPGEAEEFPEGYCHFPLEYGEKFFRQLVAEELVIETTKTGQKKYQWHIPHGRRNEAHDCRVYAMGALYVFASLVSEEIFEGEEVPWAKFWEWIEKYFLQTVQRV